LCTRLAKKIRGWAPEVNRSTPMQSSDEIFVRDLSPKGLQHDLTHRLPTALGAGSQLTMDVLWNVLHLDVRHGTTIA